MAELLAETPMLPEYAERMHLVYLVKGALATTAIEGNTLSEAEVAQLIQRQLKLPPSKEYLGIEVDNMVTIFNEIMGAVSRGEQPPLTREVIKQRNRQVLKDLEVEPGVVPGEISEHGVVVGPYRGAPRRDCDLLLNRLSDWLARDVPDAGSAMESAVLRALLAHLYLAWIHAFGGVPGPAAHLLSNHFNDTRTEYYRQLNHASRSGGDVVPFLVHKPPDHRRRQLAIALFRAHHPVDRADLEMLTPALTRAYAEKTGKTLTRDLRELADRGLIKSVQRGQHRAARELIQGLMPTRSL